MDLESVSPAPCQSSTVLSQVNTYDVARASAPMDTGQIGTIVHASRYNVTVVLGTSVYQSAHNLAERVNTGRPRGEGAPK